MSDNFGLTTDEALAAQRIIAERTGKGLNALLSAPATMVLPRDWVAPASEPRQWHDYVPLTGLVQAGAGAIGSVIDAASTLSSEIDKKIGWGKPMPSGSPEILTQAGEAFEDTRGHIKEGIAKRTPLQAPDMNDPIDVGLDTFFSTLGGVAVPTAPTRVAKAFTNLLPYGLKTIGGMFTPSVGNIAKNAPIGAVMGGVNTGIVAAEGGLDSPPPETATQPAPATATQPTLQVAAQPAPEVVPPQDATEQGVQVAANTNKDTATDVGLNAYLATQKQQQPTAPAADGVEDVGLNAALGVGDQSPAAPELDATGRSDMTRGRALATIGTVLVGLGAARFLHGHTRAITDAERTARFSDPDYAAKAADYNNSVIARGGSRVSAGLTAPPPPPLPEYKAKIPGTDTRLPVSARQGMNYANDQIVNEHAQAQDIIRMTAKPSEAEALAHQYGNTYNQMRFRTKLGQFLETGRDADTGISTVAHNKVYRDIAGLNPDQQRILAEGLSAANEENNRTSNRRAWAQANPGVAPKPEDIRHDFKNQSDADLATARRRMMNDPVVADVATRFKQIPHGMVKIGEKYGFFTQAEARRLLTEHPDYVPEVKNGEIIHPFGRRDKTVSTGVEQMNAKPWDAMAQHVEELYRQFETNRMNQMLRESMLETQRTNPGAAKLVYDVDAPKAPPTFYSGGSFRDPVVAIRTPNGTKFTRTDHPDVFNMLTGGSLMKQRISAGVLGTLKNWQQYWITGPGSLINGYVAPLANAGYTAATMPINMPKNMYGGVIDRAVQRTTGHTSGVARGLDMVTTALPGTAYSYGRGVVDRRAMNLSNLIAPGNNNTINQTLRAYLGNAQMDALSQRLRNYYHDTLTYKMKAELGLGGQGLPVKADSVSLNTAADRQASLVAARAVPELFVANGMFGRAKPLAIKLNNVITEAMSNLSDAGHDYAARLNWNNPNISHKTLTYETRNLTGDPGVRGSNRYLNALTDIVPFGNISIQGTARLGRTALEQPLLTATTVATGLGTIVLAELLTHMRSPEHMDYYNDQLSTSQQARGIVLATSEDPNSPTIINLPQELRTLHAVAKDFISGILNSAAIHHDEDWYHNVFDTITDFLGSHVTNTSISAMKHGVADVIDTLNPPSVLGHVDWFSVMDGKSLADSSHAPSARVRGVLPNQVPDGLFDDKQGQMMRNILTAGFGGLAGVLDSLNAGSRYAKQTGSWLDGLGMAGHDWLQQAKDRNPQLNFIYEHQLRTAQQAPIAEVTQQRLDELKKVVGARTAEHNEGLTTGGRYGQPVPTTVDKQIPTDETLKQMYQIAGAYKTRMAGRETEIAQIKKQIAAYNAQGMDNDEKRKWINDRTRDVADKYRMISSMLNDLDYALSLTAGVPVHIGQGIDWHGTMDQFAK